MKKIFTTFINKLLIITCFLFSIKNGNAANNPIAEAVGQKHDLNISFPTYNLFTNVQDTESKNLPQELSIGTVVNLKSKELFSLLKQSSDAISVNIPFDGDIITVELINVNILTPDFTIHTSDKNNISYTPGKYYRGIIKDNPNSIAAFSFFNDELYGVISDDVNGNIVIGRVLQPGNINKYIIYSDKDLIRTSLEFCKMANYTPDTKYLHQLSLLPSSSERCSTPRNV